MFFCNKYFRVIFNFSMAPLLWGAYAELDIKEIPLFFLESGQSGPRYESQKSSIIFETNSEHYPFEHLEDSDIFRLFFWMLTMLFLHFLFS